MSESLWGNLDNLMKKHTPKSILKEQANHLQRETNGMLVVKVSSQGDIKGDIVHKMNVSVPVLNNYKYNLLTVSHKLSLYPLTIHHPVKGVGITDEQKFEIELGRIFKSKPVRNALEALLLQARDLQQDNEDLEELEELEENNNTSDRKSANGRATAHA